MLTTKSIDGTEVRAIDEGQGPVVLLVGPGMDDGAANKKLAAKLAKHFRVLRLIRRQYRVDLKTDVKMGLPRATVAQEVEDVLAVVASVGGPVLLYGHSSGAVVALEALVASPSSFAGAVVFEPAAVIDGDKPLSGSRGEVLAEARTALAAGKHGKALAAFLRGPIRLNPIPARLAGAMTAVIPRYRNLIPCQINDMEAMDEVGERLDAYATIEVPVVMLGGEITDRETVSSPTKNPAHIGERLNAITKVLPNAEQVIMKGRNHSANRQAPDEVVAVIKTLADKVLR